MGTKDNHDGVESSDSNRSSSGATAQPINESMSSISPARRTDAPSSPPAAHTARTKQPIELIDLPVCPPDQSGDQHPSQDTPFSGFPSPEDVSPPTPSTLPSGPLIERFRDPGPPNGSNSPVSRRSFLKASAIAGATVMASEAVSSDALGVEIETDRNEELPPPIESLDDFPNNRIEERPGNFDEPGYPSRSAYRAIAEEERRVQRQMKGYNPGRTVNAVNHLGLSEGSSVSQALTAADRAGDLDNTELHFPKGEYRVTGGVMISPSGSFGITGKNASFVVEPNTMVAWKLNANTAKYNGFTIDQRATGGMLAVSLHTSGGNITYSNITHRGTVSQAKILEVTSGNVQQIQLLPTPENDGSIKIVNWTAMGGSDAGSHSWASDCPKPPGFVSSSVGCPGSGVYDPADGVVQYINCRLSGWENGIYASRAPKTAIHVIGGVYVNNNNASVRLSGTDSLCNGVSAVLDQRIYDVKKMPGQYKPGEIQGLNCVRSEAKGTRKAVPIKNCDLRAYKVEKLDGFDCGGLNGLIRLQDSVGAGTIKNCRLVLNQNGDTVIVANSPSGPSPPHNVLMSDLMIKGNANADPVLDIRDRGNSILKDSCIKLPNAGPQSIEGASTSNVGYGKNCSSTQGLSKPSKVANLSNLDIGNISAPDGGFGNGSGGGGGGFFKPALVIIEGTIRAAQSAFAIGLVLVILLAIIALIVYLAPLYIAYKRSKKKIEILASVAGRDDDDD